MSTPLNEIKQSTTSENDVEFFLDMKGFLDDIPKTTSLKEIFLHLNNRTVDPLANRNVYWLKNSLQQAADLIFIKYVPLTDQGERDIVRPVRGVTVMAHDFLQWVEIRG